MCRILNISKTVYYSKMKEKDNKNDDELENKIKKIFKDNRNNYGARKIKVEMDKIGLKISRRKIRKIMIKHNLVSTYTIKQFKVHKTPVNNDIVENIVDREFNDRPMLDVAVSDLTYVRVLNKWYYICFIIDLFNREVIGYSCGPNKNADLVTTAFRSIKYPLSDINIFHTDCGSEFKNKTIEEILTTFNIKRSLSKKGCPYDNAVAEAGFKVLKTEFAFNRIFDSFEELNRELFDYVNWYNNIRIHGSLGYVTPIEYRNNNLMVS
jgi:transposase InsO family protein